MRKFLLIMCLLSLTTALFAQGTGLSSLEKDFSFGLFPNALDYALNAGAEFSTLSDLYLFCGIGNLNKTATIGSFTASAGNLLWAGTFVPGALPYSLFAGAYLQPQAIIDQSSTLYTYGLEIEDPLGDSITHSWIQTQTDREYRVPLFTQLEKRAQFLCALGSLTTGLWMNLNLIDLTDPAANYTETFSLNYNLNAPATVPGATLDFTGNSKYVNMQGINNTIALGIPLYLKTGTIEHLLNASVEFNWADNTRAHSGVNNPVSQILETVPLDPADSLGGAFTDTINDIWIRKDNNLQMGVNYGLSVPGFLGGNAKDKFTTGIGFTVETLMSQHQWEEIFQDKTFIIGDTVFTNDARSEESEIYTLNAALNFNASVFARHTFYFPLAGLAEFGIVPLFSASYASGQDNPGLSSYQNILRTDNNGDGLFTDATDRIETTTYTYTNALFNGTAAVDKSVTQTITLVSGLPSSLKIQPDKWLFGIILGAYPYCSATMSIVTINSIGEQEDILEVDGTGAAVSHDIVNANPSTKTVQTGYAYDLDLYHNMGVYFDLGDSVHLSVDVSGALASGIWDFQNLVVQGIIKLPANSGGDAAAR